MEINGGDKMTEGIKRFEELLKTDEEFQKKLQDAVAAYTGENTEEAVFDNVIVPFAAEYNISATFDEMKAYIDEMNAREMDPDELAQVAGGTGKGGGIVATGCFYVGGGLGAGGGSESGAVCVGLGFGWGKTQCFGSGISDGENAAPCQTYGE